MYTISIIGGCMGTKIIKDLLKAGDIKISKIKNILFLNDKSIITIWYDETNTPIRHFATIVNSRKNKSKIIEFKSKTDCILFENIMPKESFKQVVNTMKQF